MWCGEFYRPMAKKKITKVIAAPTPLLLDLGCGPNKKGPDWTGVDHTAFPGVDTVLDMNAPRWPWKDNSVDEIHCSHCLEHFDAMQRCHVYNEMWRVLKPGSKVTLIVPSWSSGRAYGDPTHRFPPVSGFSFFYLLKAWRDQNAPHSDARYLKGGYKCDFDATWGFSLHPEIVPRNQEYQQHALTFFMEAAQDIIATLVKRP